MWSSWVIAAVFVVLYVVYRRRDRRMLRNGFFLLGACGFGVLAVLGSLAAVVPGLGFLVLVAFALLPLAVLVLAVFLIGNGITMLRAEGRSLGNVLSLVTGVAVLALPVLVVALVRLQNGFGYVTAAVLIFVASYAGVVFVVFLGYSIAYGRMRPEQPPAAIVVLGSKIIDGRVPPLLRSRLDRGLAVYRAFRAQGRPVLIIPSGGQGADETRSEGAAMAEYLVDQGADPADVIAEEHSTNTRENLVLSAAVQRAAGRPGPVLAVTNNYHVLRAALIARRIGSDAEVIGSPTARYYVPSAFLREFVAVVVDQRKVHAVLLGVPFLAVTALFLVAYLTQPLS